MTEMTVDEALAVIDMLGGNDLADQAREVVQSQLARLSTGYLIDQDSIQPLWAALVAMVHGIHAPQDLLTQAQMGIAERVAKGLERLLEDQKDH